VFFTGALLLCIGASRSDGTCCAGRSISSCSLDGHHVRHGYATAEVGVDGCSWLNLEM